MDAFKPHDVWKTVLLIIIFMGPTVAADPGKYYVPDAVAAWIGLASAALAFVLNRASAIGDGK